MAIAFDVNSGSNPSNGTTFNHTHTCTGSNITLKVMFSTGEASDIVTSVTYNGVAMTRADTLQRTVGGTGRLYAYALEGAPTGTHDVTVNASTTMTNILCYADSYTGAGAVDSHNTKNQATTTSFSISTTVVASNCWLTAFTQDDNGGSSAGVGTVKRSTLNAGFGQQSWDSNGTVGTGSQSLAMSNGSSSNWNGIILSIAPYVAPTSHLLSLTGVGA